MDVCDRGMGRVPGTRGSGVATWYPSQTSSDLYRGQASREARVLETVRSIPKRSPPPPLPLVTLLEARPILVSLTYAPFRPVGEYSPSPSPSPASFTFYPNRCRGLIRACGSCFRQSSDSLSHRRVCIPSSGSRHTSFLSQIDSFPFPHTYAHTLHSHRFRPLRPWEHGRPYLDRARSGTGKLAGRYAAYGRTVDRDGKGRVEGKGIDRGRRARWAGTRRDS